MANLLDSPTGNLDAGGCAILGIFPSIFAGSFSSSYFSLFLFSRTWFSWWLRYVLLRTPMT